MDGRLRAARSRRGARHGSLRSSSCWSDDATYAPWFAEALDYGSAAGLEVLDVGCGQGIDVVEYARAGARVTGIDLTPRHVELARSAHRGAGARGGDRAGRCRATPVRRGELRPRLEQRRASPHARYAERACERSGACCVPAGRRGSSSTTAARFTTGSSRSCGRGSAKRQLLRRVRWRGCSSRGVERSSIDARPLVTGLQPRRAAALMRRGGFADVHSRVGVFNTIDTPISDVLARHTRLLDDPRVRERHRADRRLVRDGSGRRPR